MQRDSCFGDSYRGQKVLVFGHTGFKGSWLTLWLSQLGAHVTGASLDIPTTPSHFEVAGLDSLCDHRLLDIRDLSAVTGLIEAVHHLAVVQDGQQLPAEDLQRLLQGARPFERRLADFLASTVLQRESDFYDPRADRVTLMTLHAAKGLEFPTVFIAGCEEGVLPYLPENRAANVEEERRLFYVGMTRAQRRLILTHARRRRLFGQWLEHPRSSFVGDIERSVITAREAEQRPPQKPENVQLRLF